MAKKNAVVKELPLSVVATVGSKQLKIKSSFTITFYHTATET
jgi:hypothetical protein